jgi:hypothetical protein
MLLLSEIDLQANSRIYALLSTEYSQLDSGYWDVPSIKTVELDKTKVKTNKSQLHYNNSSYTEIILNKMKPFSPKQFYTKPNSTITH